MINIDTFVLGAVKTNCYLLSNPETKEGILIDPADDAEYIIKFLKAYRENGITISAITPQNEPNTHQNGRMPACIWHPEIEAKFVKALRKMKLLH